MTSDAREWGDRREGEAARGRAKRPRRTVGVEDKGGHMKTWGIFLLAGLFMTTMGEGVARAGEDEPMVVLETNQGIVTVKLFPDAAPKACENFLGLVKKGYYDGIAFHRVIKNFMVQGGDPTGTGAGGASIWGKGFEDEVSPDVTFDKPGILAMANAGPNTNGSQFFITVVPTPWLNMRHTIFGEVVEGYDVVKKIVEVPVGAQDRPKETQKIIRATVKEP